MASQTVRQLFTGGEVSPEIYGRVDLQRYGVSMRTMLNWITTPAGAAKNRSGFEYVGAVRDGDKYTRLIPFVFSSDVSYVVEISEGWVRFHTLGGTVAGWRGTHDTGDLVDPIATGMTDNGRYWIANQLVGRNIYNLSGGLSSGVIGSNTSDNVKCSSTSGGWTWSEGDPYLIDGVNEIPAPWAEEDLQRLDFAQFNDIMIIVHPKYAPQVLRRYANDMWTLTPFGIGRPVNPPDITAVTDENPPTGSLRRPWTYGITSVTSQGKESLPDFYTPAGTRSRYPDNDAARNDITFDVPTDGETPERYYLYAGQDGVVGFIQEALHNPSLGVQVVEDKGTAPDFSDTPPSGRDPFILTETSSGLGSATPRSVNFDTDDPPATPPIVGVATKTTAAHPFDTKYRIIMQSRIAAANGMQAPHYRVQIEYDPDGASGYGTGAQGTLYDRTVKFDRGATVESGAGYGEWVKEFNITDLVAGGKIKITMTVYWGTPDIIPQRVEWQEFTQDPDEDIPTIYPSAVAFFEQRIVLANFQGRRSEPSTLKTSKTGDLYNFDESVISEADDAIVMTLGSTRLDEIRHVVPLRSLLCFTSGAEWVIRGTDGGPLTPSDVDLKPDSWYGSSWAKPQVIGRALVFATERGRIVRELQHDPISGAVAQGQDLTALARHLYERSGVRDWAWAETPHSVLWAVREDGTLVGCTFAPEHQVWAWHRHTTGPVTELPAVSGFRDVEGRDKFESICSVPEPGENAVYVVVKRTIPGVNGGDPVRYIERMATREGLAEVQDHCMLDSALRWEGRWWKRNAQSSPQWVMDDVSTVDDETLLRDITAQVNYDGGGSPTWQVDDTPYEIEWSAVGFAYPAPVAIGQVIELRTGQYGDASWVRLEVTGITGGDGPVAACTIRSFYNADGDDSVHADLRGAHTAYWGIGLKTVSGLDHLEGETVKVLVDGGVVPDKTVSGGDIVLTDWGVVIAAGLAIQADIETLHPNVAQDPGELRKRLKTVAEVGLELDNWKGLKVGQRLDNVVELDQRDVVEGYGATQINRGISVVRPFNRFEREVAVALRQDDPLPVSVLALLIELEMEVEPR